MKKISSIQTLSIFFLSIGLLNHVILIPFLLSTGGRDSWFFSILTIGLIPIWVYILSRIIKNMNNQSLTDWLENRFGKHIKNIVLFFIVIYLISLVLATTKETVDWITTSFLFETPSLAIIIPFTLLCIFLAHSGMRSIAICSSVLLPIVVILGIFVATGNIPTKDYSHLLPLFENGYFHGVKTFQYSGYGLTELILIAFFQEKLSDTISRKTLVFLCLGLVFLLLGPLTAALAEFGPTLAEAMRYPAYEQWRLLTIGKYIEHTDFFSIYQWLAGAYIRVSLALFLITEVFNRKTNQMKVGILFAVGFLMVVISIVPYSNFKFLHVSQTFYYPGAFYFLLLLSAFLFIGTFISSKEGKRSENETIKK
ncbi:endospore germination permease [Peribacillus simplex]|uniref:Endospore germination permease n=2 Tax=Peribacillus TaxID=2675229 RepID=A0AA90SKW3_9BACI|nr:MULTISPECIES: endospore germination permease [Peribacillus]MDP1420731.1 endospore germination permease [Peribacillus simplex]MDP1452381.1 endospore germination permease [Peribacillus frigoritolerans]